MPKKIDPVGHIEATANGLREIRDHYQRTGTAAPSTYQRQIKALTDAIAMLDIIVKGTKEILVKRELAKNPVKRHTRRNLQMDNDDFVRLPAEATIKRDLDALYGQLVERDTVNKYDEPEQQLPNDYHEGQRVVHISSNDHGVIRELLSHHVRVRWDDGGETWCEAGGIRLETRY